MKINGMNVIGVKHLAGLLKGLNGYGIHYEVFLPIAGGKLKIHEHVSGNSWTFCDPDEYIFIANFSVPRSMKEIKKIISVAIERWEADYYLLF